jgi:hypothetical protein
MDHKRLHLVWRVTRLLLLPYRLKEQVRWADGSSEGHKAESTMMRRLQRPPSVDLTGGPERSFSLWPRLLVHLRTGPRQWSRWVCSHEGVLESLALVTAADCALGGDRPAQAAAKGEITRGWPACGRIIKDYTGTRTTHHAAKPRVSLRLAWQNPPATSGPRAAMGISTGASSSDHAVSWMPFALTVLRHRREEPHRLPGT